MTDASTRKAVEYVKERLAKLDAIGYVNSYPRWTNKDFVYVSLVLSEVERLMAQEKKGDSHVQNVL